jgi:branched-subunit amino acid transport system permease/uncharacterized protein DUF1298
VRRPRLALKANEKVAAARGVDVARTKLYAFAIASFVAGLGGSLLAYQQTLAAPDIYSTFVPLTANISIGVGALSYARQFNLAVVADRELCRDVDVFVDGVRRSLAALEAEPFPRSPRSPAP